MERHVKSIKFFIDNVLNDRRVDYKIDVMREILKLYEGGETNLVIDTFEDYKTMADLMLEVKRQMIWNCNNRKKEEI